MVLDVYCKGYQIIKMESGNLQENIKLLETIYNKTKIKTSKLGNYNSIKYTYVSTTTIHKHLEESKLFY